MTRKTKISRILEPFISEFCENIVFEQASEENLSKWTTEISEFCNKNLPVKAIVKLKYVKNYSHLNGTIYYR